MCRDCGCSLGPAAQRALIAAAPSDTAQVDLAIALLREGRHKDEADDLLADLGI